MSVLHSHSHSSLKYYEIVSEIFLHSYSEVEYFDENIKKSGSVLSVACSRKHKMLIIENVSFSSRMMVLK
jgi:hypothetical protein